MSSADASRAEMRAACLALLDRHCIEHPAGHQSKLAARYVLVSQSGERIPLMFEKAPHVTAQLWLRKEHAAKADEHGFEARDYPATALYSTNEDADTRHYGRHSALRTMRDMANVDLVRLTIERAGQLRQLIEEISV